MASARGCTKPADHELFTELTSLHDCRQAYSGEQRGELFIHWFYCARKDDRLSKCEAFHLNMLQWFAAMDRVETIHVRCAVAGQGPTAAMQQAIGILSSGRAKVDFKCVPPKKDWEHDTIKEAVEYAVATGKFVYYTHFKGVSRIYDSSVGTTATRDKYGALDVLYWCYLLYESLFAYPRGGVAKGPILRNGCNKSYQSSYDCSWCVAKKVPQHYYAGSFQAFDGQFLARRFEELGMDAAGRSGKLWVGDPYTVEMFLSLCTSPTEVSFDHIGIGLKSYELFRDKKYKASLQRFKGLFNSAPMPKVRGSKVVLTYMYGKHSLLREPKVIDEGVRYVCISDRPVASKIWEVVVEPLKHLEDDRLRVAYVKFHPFEFVDAPQVLVLNASYHIEGSVLPLFSCGDYPVMLLPHLYRDRLREELDTWVELHRMTPKQAQWFKSIVPYLGGSLDSALYELSASVWRKSWEAEQLGRETYAVLEYNGFPSDQIPCSMLAACHFAGSVGSIPAMAMSGLIKYKHNTWEPCPKQSRDAAKA